MVDERAPLTLTLIPGTGVPILVSYLADHPTHLPTVAGWIFRQWGQRPGNSAEATAERLVSHVTKDSIPLMLLALDGETCVGCASLRPTDLPGYDHIGPWMASVYVPEDRRCQGIGSHLVTAIEAQAGHLKYAEVYLFTPDRDRFYARLGWEIVERPLHNGVHVSVMRRMLPATSDAAAATAAGHSTRNSQREL